MRTTRVPEGRIQRINAIVVLGFDAGADEIRRARQMAYQALGLLPARGDQLSVFALPAAALRRAEAPAATPEAQHPVRIPKIEPISPPSGAVRPFVFPQWSFGAAAAVLVMLGAIGWLRARRTSATEVQVDDLDTELDGLRSQVLADPRVAADVIKLWMRT